MFYIMCIFCTEFKPILVLMTRFSFCLTVAKLTTIWKIIFHYQKINLLNYVNYIMIFHLCYECTVIFENEVDKEWGVWRQREWWWVDLGGQRQICVCVWVCVCAVSYTHLDVYKRQLYTCWISVWHWLIFIFRIYDKMSKRISALEEIIVSADDKVNLIIIRLKEINNA